MTSLSPQQLWQLSSIYRYEDVEGELDLLSDEMVTLKKPTVMISISRLSLSSQLIVAGADEGASVVLKVKVA